MNRNCFLITDCHRSILIKIWCVSLGAKPVLIMIRWNFLGLFDFISWIDPHRIRIHTSSLTTHPDPTTSDNLKSPKGNAHNQCNSALFHNHNQSEFFMRIHYRLLHYPFSSSLWSHRAHEVICKSEYPCFVPPVSGLFHSRQCLKDQEKAVVLTDIPLSSFQTPHSQ